MGLRSRIGPVCEVPPTRRDLVPPYPPSATETQLRRPSILPRAGRGSIGGAAGFRPEAHGQHGGTGRPRPDRNDSWPYYQVFDSKRVRAGGHGLNVPHRVQCVAGGTNLPESSRPSKVFQSSVAGRVKHEVRGGGDAPLSAAAEAGLEGLAAADPGIPAVDLRQPPAPSRPMDTDRTVGPCSVHDRCMSAFPRNGGQA